MSMVDTHGGGQGSGRWNPEEPNSVSYVFFIIKIFNYWFSDCRKED